MSKLSELIAGCSDQELAEQEFSRIKSRNDVASTPGVKARGNVRFATGRTMAAADLDEKRKRYSPSTTTWFKK
ncbi:MAG: hypothetical protein ACYDCO_27710 [Armatimonadota bacterium]